MLLDVMEICLTLTGEGSAQSIFSNIKQFPPEDLKETFEKLCSFAECDSWQAAAQTL